MFRTSLGSPVIVEQIRLSLIRIPNHFVQCCQHDGRADPLPTADFFESEKSLPAKVDLEIQKDMPGQRVSGNPLADRTVCVRQLCDFFHGGTCFVERAGRSVVQATVRVRPVGVRIGAHSRSAFPFLLRLTSLRLGRNGICFESLMVLAS